MRHVRRRQLWLYCCWLFVGCGGGDVDGLIANLNSKDPVVRQTAVRDLTALQSTDPEVLAAFRSATRDSDRDVRRLACFALGEARSGADELNAAITDSQLSVQMAAAFALLKLETGHRQAIDVLTNTMKLGDGGVIVAVSQQGPDAEWAIPTLIELTRDRRPGIRRLAVDGLGAIGSATPEVFSALQRAQQDQDERVRESVTAAIARINGV